ncbi:MAG: type IIA DNA topoisomerase subunit B, partial [Candidatus Latescibacteria bacterium]|nr:type IIA DNA topoisomerase subunit B [Candidatus Latescibacterota bacterium]
TPLFRVRNSKETHYCYTEKESEEIIKSLRGPEVTRFKGLGEISPKEFGQFIGKDIRLIKVDVRSMAAVPNTLEFYMGKNTTDRRDYIIENLV